MSDSTRLAADHLASMIVAAGGNPISGWGEGDALDIEPMGDSWTTTVGGDGDIVRSFTGQKTFNITLRLLSTSTSNDVLSALHVADTSIAKAGGPGLPFSFFAKDINGTSLFAFTSAWITKLPKYTRANAQKDREWTLCATDGAIFIGGALPIVG